MLKPAPRSTETLPDSWASTAWSSKKAHASWVIGARGRPSDAYALPYTVWAWHIARMSGCSAWTAEWITKPAWLTA